ncbi:hypothetical protein GF323_06905 [Candidatus Woesearchaeota archaeon]|nr:hypothetical protein [Candidatus Woesearchaeota archaeon]
MEKGRYMTPTELRLYKEAIIREYRLKSAERHKAFNTLKAKLRKILPINIALGLGASMVLIWLKGWAVLLQVFLTSIIWITLTSSIVGAIVGKK